MSRPRKNFFISDADVYRIGPDIPLAVGQKVTAIGHGETEYIILKIHPRKGGVTARKS